MLRVTRRGAIACLAAFSLFGLSAAQGATPAARGGACPVDALEDAKGITEITFWHVLTAENEDVLEQQVADFEAQHPEIDVTLVNQTDYPDLLEKYIAGLSTGELPDLGQFEETALQTLVDSQSTVPIEACVEADDYELDDFLPQTIEYYTTQDVLRSMPWTVSNPVVIYNRNLITAAGIDPDEAPETLDELREYAQQVVDAGVAEHGMSLHVEPFVNEFLYAKSGLPYVNHANGRSGRATKSMLDARKGAEIWSWWQEMVESGLASNTGSQTGDVSHLISLGTGDAAMTFEASGAFGPIDAVLATGQFGDAQIGAWPLPALEPGGGVPVGDGSLWLPDASSKVKKAAAWELVKFLVSAEQQAALNVSSRCGFVPIRQSALEDPALQALWDERPYCAVPYQQMLDGASNPVSAGSVIGDYQGVRDAVREGFERMLSGDASPREALRDAAKEATAAIQEYNARVGA